MCAVDFKSPNNARRQNILSRPLLNIDNNFYHKISYSAQKSFITLFIYYKSGTLEKLEAKPWENYCVVNE